jgi:hypothetical protein
MVRALRGATRNRTCSVNAVLLDNGYVLAAMSICHQRQANRIAVLLKLSRARKRTEHCSRRRGESGEPGASDAATGNVPKTVTMVPRARGPGLRLAVFTMPPGCDQSARPMPQFCHFSTLLLHNTLRVETRRRPVRLVDRQCEPFRRPCRFALLRLAREMRRKATFNSMHSVRTAAPGKN